MLKISYADCPGPSPAISVQFTLQGVYKSSLTNFQEISMRFPGHI